MSTRQIRRYLELNKVNQEPLDVSQEDFEPQYAKKTTSGFAGLVQSSPSQSEAEVSAHEEEQEVSMAPTTSKSKKKNNKKKKRNKKQTNKLDEIERIVDEVNEILGKPEPVSVHTNTIETNLLKVDSKNLDYNEEFRRKFGSDPEDDKKRRQKGHTRLPSRRMIAFTEDRYYFQPKGLKMDLIEEKDGVKYFKFSYLKQYAHNMAMLMYRLKPYYETQTFLDDILEPNTVESMIENSDMCFIQHDDLSGITAVEQAIYFMQTVVDHRFNYYDGITRLEYKYVENRVFHVSLLKYVHILSNKACHRTALEVAKIMLSLDPSDPLAVIFIIDTLAIRAREHQWLIDLYDYWKVEKQTNKLFNMRYSTALAMWHIAQKPNNPYSEMRKEKADALLRGAMVIFPNVTRLLMEMNCKKNSEVLNHEFFSTMADKWTSRKLRIGQTLYCKLIHHLWRERGVMEWVTEIALSVVARYNADPEYKEELLLLGKQHSSSMPHLPLEIKRHIHSIAPMAEYLDIEPLSVNPRSFGFNPYPSYGECVDVGKYYLAWGLSYPQSGSGIMSALASSLIPEVPQNRG